MKNILQTSLLLAAVFAASNAFAAPITGQISIGGYGESANAVGMGAATGIDFAGGSAQTISGTSGDIYSFGAGTGSFAALGACSSSSGSCGTIQDIANFSTDPATTSFLTLNTGGPAVSFDLSNILSVVHGNDASGGSVTFTADGTLNFAGYDPTAADFILTAQGSNIVSFSATTLATNVSPSPAPEPAAWTMMLAGLAGLGLVIWRRANNGVLSA